MQVTEKRQEKITPGTVPGFSLTSTAEFYLKVCQLPSALLSTHKFDSRQALIFSLTDWEFNAVRTTQSMIYIGLMVISVLNVATLISKTQFNTNFQRSKRSIYITL